MILNELFESRMSDLDIEYQDFLNKQGKHGMSDQAFQDAYGMSRTEWAKKNKEWTWQKERRPVAPDAHLFHEGAMKDLYTELANKYRELAPKIEKYKDSYLAGELYDALEEIAEQHGAIKEFRSMLDGARNRAHMDYDTNPGGFQNWFWYLPFADEQDVAEGVFGDIAKAAKSGWDKGVASGYQKKLRSRINPAYHKDYDIDSVKTRDDAIALGKRARAAGHIVDEGVMDVVKQTFNDNVAGWPMGTSDEQFIQGWSRDIKARTGKTIPTEKLAQLYNNYVKRSGELMQSHGTTNEGSQTFNKPEPYWVCVNGKKWKRFDTYQQARNIHDKLEKKLRSEGSDKKISLLADDQLDEKQDACYRKVKSRYKVWPSAYASGALVQCRKKGADNWGNKSKK